MVYTKFFQFFKGWYQASNRRIGIKMSAYFVGLKVKGANCQNVFWENRTLVNVFSFLKIRLGYIFFVTKTTDSVF